MNRYTTSEVSPSVGDPTEPHTGHPVQRVQAGAVLFVVIGTAVAVTLRDPHEPGSFGVCPSLLLFGSYCPGCGTLRGMADLISGDISATVGPISMKLLLAKAELRDLTKMYMFVG